MCHVMSSFILSVQPRQFHQTGPGSIVKLESALFDVVNQPDYQNENEKGDDAGDPETDSLRDEVTKTNRPRIQKHNLDVEDDKNHRDEVELHRVPLASGTDWIHTTFVSRGF